MSHGQEVFFSKSAYENSPMGAPNRFSLASWLVELGVSACTTVSRGPGRHFMGCTVWLLPRGTCPPPAPRVPSPPHTAWSQRAELQSHPHSQRTAWGMLRLPGMCLILWDSGSGKIQVIQEDRAIVPAHSCFPTPSTGLPGCAGGWSVPHSLLHASGGRGACHCLPGR